MVKRLLKVTGFLLVVGLVFGITTTSESRRNPAEENVVDISPQCAGTKVTLKSNPESPVCVGTTVHFSIDLPPGWTFKCAGWTFEVGKEDIVKKTGVAPSITYTIPGEDYKVTMNGRAKDKEGQCRCISGAIKIAVFKVNKIEVSPKKVEVLVGNPQEFKAKAFDTKGNNITKYIADKIQWSTEGQGKEEIGDVKEPKKGSTTTFIAREGLPEGKNTLMGHVIATWGDISGQALVAVFDWEIKMYMRIVE